MSPLRLRRESRVDNTKREYADLEFLTEHLGYQPVTLLDALYNAHLVTLYQTIESLQEYAEAIPGLTPHAIDSAMQRLENKVDNVLDESFDIFQNYFYEHILKLPPKLDIPLEHHKDLDLDCNEEQEALLDKELAETMKTVQQQKAFNCVLKQKLEALDEEKLIIQKYSKALEILSIPKKRNIYPINDVVKFVHDQSEVLREKVLGMIRQISQEGVLDQIEPDDRLKMLQQRAEQMLEAFRRAEERKMNE